VERRGWEYVERKSATGIVVVVAVTRDQKLVLVEQRREPLGGVVVELPAGLAGDRGQREALEEAARRELVEETGYEAKSFEVLAVGPPSAGLSTEVVSVFLARGLKRVSAGGGDSSEDIRVREVPLRTVDAWLRRQARRGAHIDVKIYAGLYFLTRSRSTEASARTLMPTARRRERR
jgi:ADP-ribose pyrophosphatase